MKALVMTSLRTTLVTFLLTGLLYPLAVTGMARLLFPHQAGGSPVQDERGRVVGSALIGQRFQSPAYFHGRPSAAGAEGYDGAASSGSNLGPTSATLRKRVAETAARLRQENGEASPEVPAALVTASASGLDPHLSPEAARWQAARVASARQVSTDRVLALIEDRVEERSLGVLGEPRVNVLLLNLALDRQFGPPSTSSTAGARF